MGNLLSGLESLGINVKSNMKVFEEDPAKKAAGSQNVKAAQELKEVDVIYDKAFKCPICDAEFTSKVVKTGKLKNQGMDDDLRPRAMFDTLKYDGITCPHCGYSTLARYWNINPTTGQMKLIKDNVTKGFKGIPATGEIFTYDDAILRHKMALVCSIVKRSKSSEKAYICLKMGWLYRGKAEHITEELDPLDARNPEDIKKELKAQEIECLTNAYDGFTEAFSKENFPMAGMDENTVTFLSAQLAKIIGKYDDALRLCARVITGRNVNDRIKEKARMLKEDIYEESGRREG